VLGRVGIFGRVGSIPFPAHYRRGKLIRVFVGMARACPGVRELSVVHVSVTFVDLQWIIDFNAGHVPRNPSTNQVREWGEIGLPRLKRSISAFKNLSTIVLIHRTGRYFPKGYRGWADGWSEPLWNEVKDLAICRLQRSSAEGPKKLKTITVWVGDKFEPVLEMEEIVI